MKNALRICRIWLFLLAALLILPLPGLEHDRWPDKIPRISRS